MQGRKRRSQQEALGSAPGSVAGGFKAGSPRPSPDVTQLAPWLQCLCSSGEAGGGWVAAASELLQAAVHLPLALLACPRPALGAELLQVFFKVLVMHGPVAGGLTVGLGDKSG